MSHSDDDLHAELEDLKERVSRLEREVDEGHGPGQRGTIASESMSTKSLIVAKKDYLDAIWSRSLWSLTALFVVFTSGMVFVLTNSGLLGLYWPIFLNLFVNPEIGLQTTELSFFLVGPTEILVPIVALVMTHKSIAGEIESGSVKFLLSMPITRLDTLVGKVVGRAAVLWTALLVGFAITSVAVAVIAGEFEVGPYVTLVVLTLVFALAYVSIGVALSAVAKTGTRAVLYAVSFYIVVGVLMDFAQNLLWFLTNGSFVPPQIGTSGPPDAPGWFFLVDRLAPGPAYKAAVTQYVGGGGEMYTFSAAFPDGIPFFLTGFPALITVLLWVLLPAMIGYRLFNRADIG